MYEVQTASGVLTALSALKDYEKFVPDNSIKLGLEYDFFARSAVQWSCSKAKMAEAVEAMKNVDIEGQEDGKDLLKTAMIMLESPIGCPPSYAKFWMSWRFLMYTSSGLSISKGFDISLWFFCNA